MNSKVFQDITNSMKSNLPSLNMEMSKNRQLFQKQDKILYKQGLPVLDQKSLENMYFITKTQEKIVNITYVVEYSKSREVLVDWIVQTHYKFSLLPETLYLTISIMDRYLEIEKIPVEEFQLIGITSLWLAAKYHQVYPPTLDQFEHITNRRCARNAITECELRILTALQFQLHRPTIDVFLYQYISQDPTTTSTTVNLASYYAQSSLQDIRYADVPPSQIAIASLCLARYSSTTDHPWPNKLQKISNCSLETALQYASLLSRILQHRRKSKKAFQSRQLSNVDEKFQRRKRGRVSILPIPTVSNLKA